MIVSAAEAALAVAYSPAQEYILLQSETISSFLFMLKNQ